MKNQRRGFLLLLCCALLIVMCMTSSTQASGVEGTIEYRMSLVTAVDDPITVAANVFAEKVKERTEGRVTVEVFPASQLGDYTAVFDEVMRGTIDMAYANPTDKYKPDIYLSYLPYLVMKYEDLPKVYGKESYLFRETDKLYGELGMKFLGYGTVGFLGVGASKPLLDKDHKVISGSLVRTSPDMLSQLTMKAFGFNVNTMPYVDVFSGLQTHIIDGWLGGNPSINYLSFRDVIDYYYHFKVLLENYHFFCNKNNFNRMNEKDQQTFVECATEMLEQSYADAQTMDEQYLKKLADSGITVVLFSDAELDAMAAKIREEVWPQIAKDKYSEDFINGLANSLK